MVSHRYLRFWAILLALVLTLFPLEGALATPAAYADASMPEHGTAHNQGRAAVDCATETAHDREHCPGHDCGMNSGCGSVHCAACVLAMASPVMLPQKITGADALPRASRQETTRDVLSALFRPPRG